MRSNQHTTTKKRRMRKCTETEEKIGRHNHAEREVGSRLIGTRFRHELSAKRERELLRIPKRREGLHHYNTVPLLPAAVSVRTRRRSGSFLCRSSVRWSAGGEGYMRAENRGGDQRAISSYIYMRKLIFSILHFFFFKILTPLPPTQNQNKHRILYLFFFSC